MSKLVKQAFTLIELLVVIAIIGILSALIVVSMGGMTTKANIAKAQVFSNSLRSSLMMNTVGEWKFEGPTTINQTAIIDDIKDTWGSNNTGISVVGTPTVKGGSDCVSGKCLLFNGTTDYIDCGNGASLNLTGSFTLSAWIKSIGLDVGYILGRFNASESGYMMRANGSSITLYYGSSTSVSSDSFAANDDWNLITTTLSNGTVSFYRNGIFVGSDPGVTILTADTVHNTIGNRHGGTTASHFFNGLIDDARIYNLAISASKIREQYFAGLNSLFLSGGIKREEYLSRLNNYAQN